jgi:transcriptional regulator with XRE-family HTH domain
MRKGETLTPGAAESGLYARIVEDVRETALTTEELASITGVAERQVYNWASGTSRPRGSNRDRLLEVHYIVERLSDVYEPEGVDIWLHGRNAELGSERPIDLLRANRFEPVVHAVERLRTGAT